MVHRKWGSAGGAELQAGGWSYGPGVTFGIPRNISVGYRGCVLDFLRRVSRCDFAGVVYAFRDVLGFW